MEKISNQTYIKMLTIALSVTVTIIIVGLFYFIFSPKRGDGEMEQKNISNFYYTFNVAETLEETNSMEKSPSPYWWINSGGYLSILDGVGKTPAGEQPINSKWKILYENNNPKDTDNGLHPQNLFRMITKSRWQNFRQEAYFKIKEYNLSQSENRNLSNGMFLLTHYQDKDNTYYVGLRVDGNAIIKKKINGKYFTLAEKKISTGKSYEREKNPIIIPEDIWLGIRAETQNTPDGKVMLEMSVDIGKTGTWTPVLQFLDDGKVGGKQILNEGFAGIRTDFMDVEFSDYSNIETKATVM